MPAESVFLLLNSGDELHGDASRLWERLADEGRPILLTDWIIAETGNGLARPPARSVFPRAVSLLLASGRTRLICVTDGLRARALDLYAARPDKSWGLVDCASFISMRDEGATDALTNDRHFEQAGFRCLLPPPQ